MRYLRRVLMAVLTVASLLVPTLVVAQVLESSGSTSASLSDSDNSENFRIIEQFTGTMTAVAAQGTRAYATTTDTLMVLDGSDADNPVVEGTSQVLEDTDNRTYMVAAGDHVYLAKGEKFQVVDVSNPAAPVSTGAYVTPDHNRVTDVAVAGNYAYLAAGALRILDISDPAHPTEVDSVEREGSGFIGGVAVAGDRLYAGALTSDNTSILVIFDISSPAHPAELGYYESGQQLYRYIPDVVVAGEYAYLAIETCLSQRGCFNNHVQVVNVSDPAAPIQVATYQYTGPLPPPNGEAFNPQRYDLRQLVQVGDLLYVAAGRVGLLVVDISNPRNPVEVGRYHTVGDVRGVAVGGDSIYLADGTEGLIVLGVTGSISGQVTHANGMPIEGVEMINTREGAVVTTDASGTYTFPHESGLSVTITPAFEGYSFTPPTRTVANFENVMNASFVMLAAPVSTVVTPNNAATLSYNDTQGLTTDLHFPAGAVEVTTTLRLVSTIAPDVPNQTFAGHAFDLVAYQNYALQPELTFSEPVTLTIRYSDADVRLVNDESELTIQQWNGSVWEDAAERCAPASTYERDEANNLIRLSICGAGRLALFGPTHQQHLPLLFRPNQ